MDGMRQNKNEDATVNTSRKAQTVPMFNMEDLFKGGREVKLFHHCQEYRLRITKNKKLILTK